MLKQRFVYFRRNYTAARIIGSATSTEENKETSLSVASTLNNKVSVDIIRSALVMGEMIVV